MKKLISCLLAVLLVCSLMSMNVFAAKTPVVGNNPDNGNVNDGKDDFTSIEGIAGAGGSTDIKVNFGQGTTTNPGDDAESDEDDIINGGGDTIVHKYAVDITYGEFMLDLTKVKLGEEKFNDKDNDGEVDEGEMVFVPYYMVWDVNNYKYVLCTKSGEGANATYTPVDLTTAEDKTGAVDQNGQETQNGTKDILETPFTLDSKVTVTNHSDLSVFTKLVLKNDRTDIKWEISATAGDSTETAKVNDLTATEEITKATANTGNVSNYDGSTDGSTYSFTATPNVEGEGWLGVVGNLLNTPKDTIGQITITIAPNAIA
jgi:hypothetical protein